MNNERKENENDVIEKIKTDSKYFYKYAKKYSATNENISPLMDEKGNIVNGSKNMAELLLKQYRSDFLSPHDNYDEYNHHDYKCSDMGDFFFS